MSRGCWGAGAHPVRRRYLRGQQRVGVEALHAADQLVLGAHHVVHERPAEQEPVRASVHCDALWDLAVAEAPHVCVALKEETVQTLLTDEAGEQREIPPHRHHVGEDREGKGALRPLTARCPDRGT